MRDPSFFEVLEDCVGAWRFRPDEVPEHAIERILEAAIKAPSGGNLQPWRFVVIREPRLRQGIANIYARSWQTYVSATRRLGDGIITPRGERALKAGEYLAQKLGEVPVIIIVGAINWAPALRSADADLQRLDTGTFYGSIYPAVQNLMLAASALGLATRLTTIHRIYEAEVKDLLEIPSDVETVALVPLGYPATRHKRRRRRPLSRVVYWDRWGRRRLPG